MRFVDKNTPPPAKFISKNVENSIKTQRKHEMRFFIFDKTPPPTTYFFSKNVGNSIKHQEKVKWDKCEENTKWVFFWQNYFMTSLPGKNEVEVKFENSMHNYNATLVHWYHTLGGQSVVLVLLLFIKWYQSEYWSLKNLTILCPHYEVKMRSMLNLKTVSTTTRSP